MPDEDQRYKHRRRVTVMISAEGVTARLAELAVKRLYLSVERAKSEMRESPEVVARFKSKLKAAERAVDGKNAPHDEQRHSRPVDQTIHAPPVDVTGAGDHDIPDLVVIRAR
jgi:hypothetical protein